MDKTLKGLVGLVGASDVETRCAALLVLTQLEADDDAAVKGVRAALHAPNVVVRDFALGYFEKILPKSALADLLPLLDSEDERVRHRAAAIVSSYGSAAIAAVKGLLKEAPKRRVNAIVEICGKVRSAP